ncbi:MAG: SdrD B-like domain-containing protein [Bacteroidota bacterium]
MKPVVINIMIVSFLVLSMPVKAQRYLRKGDRAFEREQYKTAIDYYKEEFQRSDKSRKTRAEVSYKTARAYMQISDPENALAHYNKADQYNYHDHDMYFEMAEAYLQHEEFDSALMAIEKYEKMYPDDPRVDEEIDRINQTLEMLENPSNIKVKIAAILNSGEMDFCPFFGYRDYEKIFFTSSRSILDDPDINLESGQLFTNIYEAERDKSGQWKLPEKTWGTVNTKYDEGAASLNRRYNVLYFTRCDYDPKADRPCRIYKAKRRGSYWTSTREVIIPGIPEGISIGHPSIADDECTLYFVVDSMLGGYGGKDIYMVTRERKSKPWGAPKNLGPDINTEHDDCFPYIRKNGLLYFASDGHNSMGGLDIFEAKKTGTASYEVKNMKSPVNSPADDYGIVFRDDKNEGYLTSQRRGGIGKSDIYHFINPGVAAQIKGKVYDKMRKETINNVQVELCNQNGNVIEKVKTDNEGMYDFELKTDTVYQIYFRKQPYVPESVRVSTKDIISDKTFKKDVFLEIR